MKLVIIEDRINRLEQFATFDLKREKNVAVVSGQGFTKLTTEIEKKQMGFLDEFASIACHQSAISVDVRDNLKTYCKDKNIGLIFFSGGITSSIFVDNPFPYLYINSKDFYSDHLKLFLEDFESGAKPNLLKLQFGQNWKLATLLSLRNDINSALQKESLIDEIGEEIDENERIKRFEDLKVTAFLKNELSDEESKAILDKGDYDPVSKDEVHKILNSIKRAIIQLI